MDANLNTMGKLQRSWCGGDVKMATKDAFGSPDREGMKQDGVEAHLRYLEGDLEGEDVKKRDWVVLWLTGLVAPIAMLTWGWL